MVIRSFLKCGISSSTNVTQDDKLFNEFIGRREEVDHEDNNEDAAMYDDRLSEEVSDALWRQ